MTILPERWVMDIMHFIFQDHLLIGDESVSLLLSLIAIIDSVQHTLQLQGISIL